MLRNSISNSDPSSFDKGIQLLARIFLSASQSPITLSTKNASGTEIQFVLVKTVR